MFEFSIRRAHGLALAIAALGLISSARAANPRGFERANQLYDQGKFAEAAEAYESIVKTGNLSANLFHNLGNTEYRLAQPASAMLAYERALALDPAHAEARANLALLRSQSGSKMETRRWWSPAFSVADENTFVLVACAAAWAGVFAITAIFVRRRKQNAWLGFAAAVATVVAVYAGSGAFLGERENAASLVIAKTADARLAPAEGSPSVQTLPMGSRVQVLSERGLWNYCALPSGERGWIPAKLIARIRLPSS